MAEVKAHLDRTYLRTKEDATQCSTTAHSPVLLIEFDHQTPVGLRHIYLPGVPFREHIHAVMRPNGNDYGKDLLRQHYQQHPHTAAQ
jgi:hypothetical protein